MLKYLGSFLVIIFLLAFCCSKDKTTDPVDEITDLEALYMELFNAQGDDSVDVVVADSAEVALDIDSGVSDSAEIDLDGETVFIIAYDSTVSDTADLALDCRMLNFEFGSDSTKIAMFFDCTPDGLVFDNSLIIDVGSDCFNNHPTANVVKLYIYNPDHSRWDQEAVLQKTNPRLRFEIDHFSKYAIAD